VGFNKKHQLLKSKKSLFDETNSSDKCIKDNVNPREFKPYTILRFQVLKTGPSTVKENVLSMYLVKEKRGTLQPKMSMGPLLVGEFLSDGYGRIPPRWIWGKSNLYQVCGFIWDSISLVTNSLRVPVMGPLSKNSPTSPPQNLDIKKISHPPCVATPVGSSPFPKSANADR
jgi:hypothetical protein